MAECVECGKKFGLFEDAFGEDPKSCWACHRNLVFEFFFFLFSSRLTERNVTICKINLPNCLNIRFNFY